MKRKWEREEEGPRREKKHSERLTGDYPRGGSTGRGSEQQQRVAVVVVCSSRRSRGSGEELTLQGVRDRAALIQERPCWLEMVWSGASSLKSK